MRKSEIFHISFASFIVVFWIAMLIWAPLTGAQQASSAKIDTVTKKSKLLSTTPSSTPPAELHIMGVGDIMMHEPQITAGKTASGYDFTSFFKWVAPTISKADLTFGNLETTLAGEQARYAGYPMFNAPDELATNLKTAGFDVITTANNHSLDRFEKGARRTIQMLDKVGLLHTGTFASAAERDKPLMIDKNGIKLGVLAYTYGTNGIKIPDGKPYIVNLINEPLMAKDIKAARKAGADIVIVAVHFGNEYQRKPSSQQKKTVDFLFKAGADIIFGSHPHVVQPYEVRNLPATTTTKQRKGVVIYSLGNFISNQRDQTKDIGGILSIRLSKKDGLTTIGKTEFIPTYVHRFNSGGKRVYNVLPMAETLAKRNYPPFTSNDYSNLESRYQEMSRHVISAP